MSTKLQRLQQFREDLIEQVQEIELEREVTALRTFIEGTINPDDPILSAADIAAETGWTAAANFAQANDRIRGAFWPFFRTEFELASIRAIGQTIATSTEIGRCILETLINYTVGDGIQLQWQPRDKAFRDDPRIQKAQQVMDLFLEKNRIITELQKEAIRQCMPHGEVLILLEEDAADGIPTCAVRSTDHLTEPSNSTLVAQHYGNLDYEELDWSFGVATEPFKYDKPLAYFLCWYGVPDNWEVVPAERMEHIKLNVPCDVKRGLSDYYASYANIKRARRGFSAAAEGATLQSSIAYIEKFKQGQPAAAVDAQQVTPTSFTTSRPGKQGLVPVKVEQLGIGRILRTDRDVMYGPLGAPQGAKLIEVFQSVLRMVGISWGMPEWMISGDASNNNMASSITAGSAFDVSSQGRQAFWGDKWESVVKKAMRLMGVDVDALEQIARLTSKGAQIAQREEYQDEQIRDLRHKAGVLSIKTWRAEIGLDNDEEEANISAEPKPQAMGPDGMPLNSPPGQDGPPDVPPQPQGGPPRRDDVRTEAIAFTVAEQVVRAFAKRRRKREQYCATGKGGGKNPTCGNDGGGSGPEELEVRGTTVVVHRNPTASQVKALIGKHGQVRLTVSPDGDVLAWDANLATHDDVSGAGRFKPIARPLWSDPSQVDRDWKKIKSKKYRGLSEAYAESILEQDDDDVSVESGDHWVTINGAHVLISGEGVVKTGPMRGTDLDTVKQGGHEVTGDELPKPRPEKKHKGDALRQKFRELAASVDFKSSDDDPGTPSTPAVPRFRTLTDRDSWNAGYGSEQLRGQFKTIVGRTPDIPNDIRERLLRFDGEQATAYGNTDDGQPNIRRAPDSGSRRGERYRVVTDRHGLNGINDYAARIEAEIGPGTPDYNEATYTAVQQSLDNWRNQARRDIKQERSYRLHPETRPAPETGTPEKERKSIGTWYISNGGYGSDRGKFAFSTDIGTYTVNADIYSAGRSADDIKTVVLTFADPSGRYRIHNERGRTKPEDARRALKVFANVKAAVAGLIENQHPDLISFSGEGAHRVIVYNRLSAWVAKYGNGYKAGYTGDDYHRNYYIWRADKEERLKRSGVGSSIQPLGATTEATEPEPQTFDPSKLTPIEPDDDDAWDTEEFWQGELRKLDDAGCQYPEECDCPTCLEDAKQEAFCPTGEHGGQDNSCPPSNAGSGSSDIPTERGTITHEEVHPILAAVKAGGGFTYQPVDDKTPTQGYAVASFPGAERVFDQDKITVDDIFNFLKDHADKFDDPEVHAGGWVSDGKVYLDLSQVKQNEQEAVDLGVKHNQYAIFDLGNFKEIEVPSERTKQRKAQSNAAAA